MGSSPCKSKVEGEVIVTFWCLGTPHFSMGNLQHMGLSMSHNRNECRTLHAYSTFQPPPDSTRDLSARDITYKYKRYQRSLSTQIPSQLNLY